jgi:hypothetical protein
MFGDFVLVKSPCKYCISLWPSTMIHLCYKTVIVKMRPYTCHKGVSLVALAIVWNISLIHDWTTTKWNSFNIISLSICRRLVAAIRTHYHVSRAADSYSNQTNLLTATKLNCNDDGFDTITYRLLYFCT